MRAFSPAFVLSAALAAGCANQELPSPEDGATAPDAVTVRDVPSHETGPTASDVVTATDASEAMDTTGPTDATEAMDATGPTDATEAMDAMDAPGPTDAGVSMDSAVTQDAPSVMDVPGPLPYPTRTAYRIKALQPDFWSSYDEVTGNNTGGVAMNLVWSSWEPSRRAPPCGSDVAFDGHCFTVDAAVDAAIREWTSRGVVVTSVVYGSPAWSRTGHPCDPPSPGYAIFCTPDDAGDYGRFVRLIAQRYDGLHGHGRIADFVVWNEVNANDWFNPGCGRSSGPCSADPWIAAYATLYNAAYDAVAAEQPSARVLTSFDHHFGTAFDTPAAASPLLSVQTFLRGFAPRVAPRAWRVAYHPYPPDLLRPEFSPDDWPRVTYGNLGTLVGWLRATFPTVPSSWTVELTESGINSLAPGSSDAAQASAVCDTFRNVLGTPGIDNYVYHRMVDNPVETAAGLGLGLHNADRSPKPAWAVWALANRNDTVPPMLSCGFEDLPYTRLRRSYNPARGHWASSRRAPPGFTTESSWRLLRDAAPGTTLLYECRAGQHNLLSPDVHCEGLQPLGPVGYITDGPAAGTVALYRCRVGTGSDHFVSTDPGCEGQTPESLLGHALP